MPLSGPCVLVVFSGLPGVGKTALSRRVADLLGATYLRIDSIESAIAATLTRFADNPVGYVVAVRVAAADQLRAGRSVVADAVNGVAEARDAWIEAAGLHSVSVRFVEVTCSDPDEHRRRVESRTPDMPGLDVPTWAQVQRRVWQPFETPRLLVDNVGDPDVSRARSSSSWWGDVVGASTPAGRPCVRRWKEISLTAPFLTSGGGR